MQVDPYTILAKEDWAFYERENLESIVIPDSVTKIGHGVFSYEWDGSRWNEVK